MARESFDTIAAFSPAVSYFHSMFIVAFVLNAYASSSKRQTGLTRYNTSAAIALDGWKRSTYAVSKKFLGYLVRSDDAPSYHGTVIYG